MSPGNEYIHFSYKPYLRKTLNICHFILIIVFKLFWYLAATLSIFFSLLINVLYSGPYKEYSARTEVEECDFPNNNPLQWAVNALRSQGYKVKLSSYDQLTWNQLVNYWFFCIYVPLDSYWPLVGRR